MRILITGGTGNTGRPLAALLRGFADVRVASRRPGTGGVRFDWDDHTTYRPALEGVERLYLVPPLATLDPMPMVEPFLREARAAGVRRVVLLGSLAVLRDAPGPAELRAAVERMPEWAVLRPSGFMQNFTGDHPLAVGIREHGEIRTATGTGRLGWIDAADIAAAAAAVLRDPNLRSGEYILTGPASLSYADAAGVLTEVVGRPIRKIDITVDALVRRYVEAGLPRSFATGLATVDANIRRGEEDQVTSTVRDLTGREPRSFREFVATRPEWRG